MVASKKLLLCVALFLTGSHASAVALSPYASQKKSVHQLRAATLHHLPSFTARQMTKKSNDVGSIVVPLLPFTVAVTTGVDDAGASYQLGQPPDGNRQQSTASAVDHALQALAASALNASSFADRFCDLELRVLYLPASLRQRSTLAVHGNATFTGSYYLDDPEPQQITAILVQEWNQNKDILIELLSTIVCTDNNAHGNSTCVLDDLTVELLDDAATSVYATNITLPDAYANETTGKDTTAVDTHPHKQDDLSPSNLVSYRSPADDTTGSSTTGSFPWIISTIITSTFILLVALWMTWRRIRNAHNQKDTPREAHKAQEVRRRPFHNTSFIRKHNDGHTATNNNNASTTFSDQNNIDQLLREFTNHYDDMSLVSSDPSEIGNSSSFSGLSGFPHFDLERRGAKGAFHHNDPVALASSEADTHDHGKTENHGNGSTYLPSNFRKHESFEGKYRTMSAMAKALKKDILLTSGEKTPTLSGNGGCNTGENEIMHVSRTESLKKRKEVMERQRIVERGDTDGHDERVDVCSAGEEVQYDGNS